MKRITICVLLYGPHYDLAKKCVGSIIEKLPRELYKLRIGMNECCKKTIDYIKSLKEVDNIYKEEINIDKYPLMTKMFKDISTEFVWWFDDDCFVEKEDAIIKRLEIMDSNQDKKTVVLGHGYFFGAKKSWKSFKPTLKIWCEKQIWYNNKIEPSGKYEYTKGYCDKIDKRFYFPTGYSWFARNSFIKEIEYPKGITGAGDVAIAMAIRQKGYRFQDIHGCSMGLMKVPSRKSKKLKKPDILISKEFGKSGQHCYRSNEDYEVMDYLINKYKIKSILDIGCGLGEQVLLALDYGIKAVGVDGDYTIDVFKNKNKNFILHDYTTAPLQTELYDLAWSIEFVEHIREEYISNFMKTFQCCEKAVLTYASTSQGGRHHVNKQTSDYWINIFSQYGFKYNELESLKIREIAINKWIRQKALFFEKK